MLHRSLVNKRYYRTDHETRKNFFPQLLDGDFCACSETTFAKKDDGIFTNYSTSANDRCSWITTTTATEPQHLQPAKTRLDL